jgi:hypothetical protein
LSWKDVTELLYHYWLYCPKGVGPAKTLIFLFHLYRIGGFIYDVVTHNLLIVKEINLCRPFTFRYNFACILCVDAVNLFDIGGGTNIG